MLVDEDQHDEKNNAIASKILNLFGAKDDGATAARVARTLIQKRYEEGKKKKKKKNWIWKKAILA